jgi:nitroreductase
MEALTAILTRRSIRRFTDKTISKEQIEQILKAGLNAPSAGNQQPWHFVVIDDPSIMVEIPKFHPHAAMIPEANVAILVCGDPSLETHKGYWMIDCSAATENILLAAHAIGLGACWIGVYPREERIAGMRQLLNIPEDIIPFSLIALGHPEEQKPPAERFDPSKIHTNRW